MKHLTLKLFLATALLAGCDTTVPGDGRSASDLFGTKSDGLPSLNYVYDGLAPAGIAKSVVKRCSQLVFSEEKYARTISDLEDRVAQDGFNRNLIKIYTGNIRRNEVVRQKLTADAEAFKSKHKIVSGTEAEYCVAGRSEMQAKSKIGSYLKVIG